MLKALKGQKTAVQAVGGGALERLLPGSATSTSFGEDPEASRGTPGVAHRVPDPWRRHQRRTGRRVPERKRNPAGSLFTMHTGPALPIAHSTVYRWRIVAAAPLATPSGGMRNAVLGAGGGVDQSSDNEPMIRSLAAMPQ